jgi:hypothetical protein
MELLGISFHGSSVMDCVGNISTNMQPQSSGSQWVRWVNVHVILNNRPIKYGYRYLWNVDTTAHFHRVQLPNSRINATSYNITISLYKESHKFYCVNWKCSLLKIEITKPIVNNTVIISKSKWTNLCNKVSNSDLPGVNTFPQNGNN